MSWQPISNWPKTFCTVNVKLNTGRIIRGVFGAQYKKDNDGKYVQVEYPALYSMYESHEKPVEWQLREPDEDDYDDR